MTGADDDVAGTDRGDVVAQNAFAGYAVGVLLSITAVDHRVDPGMVVVALALGTILAPWLIHRARKRGRSWAASAASALPWVMAVAGLLTGFLGPS